jgi:DNA adenine methylase
MNRVPEVWTVPLFRWAGSKRQLLSRLLEAVPNQMVRYVEPFAGSACLFFAVHPSSAILGDVNSGLIDAYETVRAHPRLVARAAGAIPHTSSEYYRWRAVDPSTLGSVDRAARFVYLNRYCFNGIYRVNRQGLFNVPIGRRTGRLLPEAAYVRCAHALRAADLVAGDYRDVIGRCRAGDFVYLDPPYTEPERRHRGEYGYGSFSHHDLDDFADALKSLDSRGVTFVVSYADTARFRAIADGWISASVTVRRTISAQPMRRRPASELLVTNTRTLAGRA